MLLAMPYESLLSSVGTAFSKTSTTCKQNTNIMLVSWHLSCNIYENFDVTFIYNLLLNFLIHITIIAMLVLGDIDIASRKCL